MGGRFRRTVARPAFEHEDVRFCPRFCRRSSAEAYRDACAIARSVRGLLDACSIPRRGHPSGCAAVRRSRPTPCRQPSTAAQGEERRPPALLSQSGGAGSGGKPDKSGGKYRATASNCGFLGGTSKNVPVVVWRSRTIGRSHCPTSPQDRRPYWIPFSKTHPP